jgi:hypothetical protein
MDANVRPGSQAVIELPCRPTGSFGVGAATGLLAEYFNGMNFEERKISRVDPKVDFVWDQGSPGAGINRDGFSVRWTGWVRPRPRAQGAAAGEASRRPEQYTFYALTDDGCRLWVDDRLLVDYWAQQNPTERAGNVALVADRWYRIRMEFFEGTGYAAAQLFWSGPNLPKEIVPTGRLFPAAQSWGDAKVAASDKSKAAGPQVVEVVTPSGRRARAALTFARDTARLSFSETQEPGLYQVLVPEGMAKIYAPDASWGGGLPLVVLGDVEESRLVPLSDADLNVVGRYVDLFRTETPEELVSAVAGGVPGQEMWKYLAIGALLILLGEITLSRWITVQRRMHAVQEVRFGGEAADVQTFRQKARELVALPRDGGPKSL